MARGTPLAAFCISRISASDRRKASIDSAPWFSLLRSACSPSRQPPVWRAVEFLPEVVAAEEPVEGALRLLVPPGVGRGAVRFQASRDRGLRLDGLLVEVRACAVAPIESVAANGPQLPMLRGLYAHQPAQRLYAAFVHVILPGGASADNQGVRQLGVVISQPVFKPGPAGLRRLCRRSSSIARSALRGHSMAWRSPFIRRRYS